MNLWKNQKKKKIKNKTSKKVKKTLKIVAVITDHGSYCVVLLL